MFTEIKFLLKTFSWKHVIIHLIYQDCVIAIYLMNRQLQFYRAWVASWRSENTMNWLMVLLRKSTKIRLKINYQELCWQELGKKVVHVEGIKAKICGEEKT